MNTPWCNISRPIPYAERKRVYVRDQGFGMTQHRITLGDTLVAIDVALDRGGNLTVSPREIVDPPEVRSAEVVQFPQRRIIPIRVVEEGGFW